MIRTVRIVVTMTFVALTFGGCLIKHVDAHTVQACQALLKLDQLAHSSNTADQSQAAVRPLLQTVIAQGSESPVAKIRQATSAVQVDASANDLYGFTTDMNNYDVACESAGVKM